MGTVELPPLEKAINYGVTAISSSDSELVDEASKLLSMELSKFKHITENYANEKYEDSFNWNELELPEYIEKDFYAVVFRSKRRQDNDYDLYKADRLAHEEAVHASKGFGTTNENLESLATCVWSSQSWAQRVSKLPKHVQAARLAGDAYEYFRLERYTIKKTYGNKQLKIIKMPLPAEQNKPTKRMIGFWEKNLNQPAPPQPQPMKVVEQKVVTPLPKPQPPPLPQGYRRQRTDQKPIIQRPPPPPSS